jgi:hypothetical protein
MRRTEKYQKQYKDVPALKLRKPVLGRPDTGSTRKGAALIICSFDTNMAAMNAIRVTSALTSLGTTANMIVAACFASGVIIIGDRRPGLFGLS